MDLRSPQALTSQGWDLVTTGQSRAVVFRNADGSSYAKFVPAGQLDDLVAERDRVEWAFAHGIPTARMLDWQTNSDWGCLITKTVDGVSADRLSAAELWRAWPSITDTLRRLHAIPAEDCPFGRGLAEMFADAEDVVRRNAVNPEFLPLDMRHMAPRDVLSQLTSDRQQRLIEEEIDLVVCHGDLCLPNVIIDPATCTVTGLVDLGRLGRADRYIDIALLLGNSRGTWTNEGQAIAADDLFADGYGTTPSAARQHFYMCLDALTWDT